LWCALPGCNIFCERSGCDTVGTPAADSGKSEIAGAVATEGDAVENGCSKCPFATWSLALWAVSGPVSDVVSAKAIIQAGPATVTFDADGRYRQALDPGSYLLCSDPASYSCVCVSVDVVAGHATPVNLKLNTGLSYFIVFDPLTHAKLAATMLYPSQ
jgi:hypothetical protein